LEDSHAGACANILDTLAMAPLLLIRCGTASCVSLTTDRTLVAMIDSNFSIAFVSIPANLIVPALLICNIIYLKRIYNSHNLINFPIIYRFLLIYSL